MNAKTSSSHRRERQIAEVPVRYRTGHPTEVVDLVRFVTLKRKLLTRGLAQTRPESLRAALGELGPTFWMTPERSSAAASMQGTDR